MDELIKKIIARSFRTSALRKTADMSYKQAQNWDKKGYTDKDRTEESKWRSYSAKEIFALQLCSQLKVFDIPPAKLRFVISHIKTKTFLEYALQLYFYGIKVYLLTDLSTFFHIYGIKDLGGYQKVYENNPHINFCITPLLDKFMNMLGIPESPLDESLNGDFNDREIKTINGMRDPNTNRMELTKSKKGIHIRKTKYIDKNIQDEIAAQKEKGAVSAITTHIDKSGKITSVKIEEVID